MSNDNMRDSGIEWIGELPAEWELVYAKYLFAERSERGNKYSMTLLSPTKQYGVIPQHLLKSVTKCAPTTNFSSFKGIHIGDFCISLRSFQNGIEYDEKYEGVVSPAYHVIYITDDQKAYDGYFRYLLKSDGFISKIASYSDSLRDGKNISFKDFGRTIVPLPPLPEQRRIATYLDARVSRIDRLVDGLSRRVELLDEYKKSLISECVTKGIRQHENMKDSGIEWVGEIPAEWDTTRLENVAMELRHKNANLDSLMPIQFKNGSLIYKPNFDASNNALIDTLKTYHLLDIDDIVLNGLNMNYDLKSKRVAISKINGCITSAYVVFHVNNQDWCNSDYLIYLLKSYDGKKVFHGMGSGIRQTIKWDELRKLHIILPPLPEQREIAVFLDERVSVIDRLMDACRKQIDSLGEYKKSLISECVTGKRRITDADLEGVPVA